MKVIVFEATEWERQAFERVGLPAVECHAESLGPQDVARYADAEAITTFIRSDLSRSVLRQLPRLRLIATRSTGFDHIDLGH